MKREDATKLVLNQVADLVRWGNGATFRDGRHKPHVLESCIRKALLEPLDSLAATTIAADLMKLAIERLTTEEDK